VFIENQASIIDGTFNVSLLDKIDELSDVLKAIEKKSVEKIYNYEGVVRIELAGFRIMSGLIEDFIEAAFIEDSKRTKRHVNTLNLLSTQFKIDESSNAYTRVMNIIDYISGMTDLFALKLYRNLRGIEMPHI
jgi:dGTPase